jgi:hypothetical protein
MSSGYAYALTKDGVIVGGGSKRYHCIYQLQDDVSESISMMELDRWKVWRLTGFSGGAVDITQKVIEEFKRRTVI